MRVKTCLDYKNAMIKIEVTNWSYKLKVRISSIGTTLGQAGQGLAGLEPRNSVNSFIILL